MEMPEQFVLDSSVTMAWFFKDERNAYADVVRDALVEGQAVVPSLWPLEVANTIVMGERRKRSTPAQAATWLALLEALPIVIDAETTTQALGQTLSLVRAQKLSAYGASYLELAMRLGLPLATLDDQLRSAAQAVGVCLFEAV